MKTVLVFLVCTWMLVGGQKGRVDFIADSKGGKALIEKTELLHRALVEQFKKQKASLPDDFLWTVRTVQDKEGRLFIVVRPSIVPPERKSAPFVTPVFQTDATRKGWQYEVAEEIIKYIFSTHKAMLKWSGINSH